MSVKRRRRVPSTPGSTGWKAGRDGWANLRERLKLEPDERIVAAIPVRIAEAKRAKPKDDA